MKVVTAANFETEVLNSDKPVLVDFSAEWCGPCKALAPILDQIAAERSDIKIVTIDVDASNDISKAYGVRAMPTLMMFRDGNVISKKVGGGAKSVMLKWIDEALALPAGTVIDPRAEAPRAPVKKVPLSENDKKRLTEAFTKAIDASPDADTVIPGQQMPDGGALTLRNAINAMLQNGQVFEQIEQALGAGVTTVDAIIKDIETNPPKFEKTPAKKPKR